MAKLTVEHIELSTDFGQTETIRIGGFNDGELSELKSMEHLEAEDKLLEMLNSRNAGLGNVYHNGYGVRSTWYDDEYAYIRIGKSCD